MEKIKINNKRKKQVKVKKEVIVVLFTILVVLGLGLWVGENFEAVVFTVKNPTIVAEFASEHREAHARVDEELVYQLAKFNYLSPLAEK